MSAYGLLTHRHTAEMEQALTKVAGTTGAGVVHAAPRADDARDPRDVLRAARPTTGLSTARLLEHYREFYANDPCVVVVDEPSGTKATYGAQRRARDGALRRAHRDRRRDRGARTTS